jgi:CRP-like cAMP-binding protein
LVKTDPDLVADLIVNPWFAALPATERAALLAAAEPLQLARGAMLYRQGDPIAGFYCLRRGELKISTLRPDGKEAILVVLEPGNWFGDVLVPGEQRRIHDATARTPCEVLVVPQPLLSTLMQRLAFAQAMALLQTARVRALYALIEDATLRTLRARVARRLLFLARGDATLLAQPCREVLHLSQEALAMMLGVSRQTLSGELKALAARGALSLGYGRITIVSFAALEACAQEA